MKNKFKFIFLINLSFGSITYFSSHFQNEIATTTFTFLDILQFKHFVLFPLKTLKGRSYFSSLCHHYRVRWGEDFRWRWGHYLMLVLLTQPWNWWPLTGKYVIFREKTAAALNFLNLIFSTSYWWINFVQKFIDTVFIWEAIFHGRTWTWWHRWSWRWDKACTCRSSRWQEPISVWDGDHKKLP